MSSQGKTLGIDVSADQLRAVAVSEDGSVSEPIVEARFDGSDPLDRIVAFVRSAIEKLGPVGAVGISIPGLINKQNGGVAYYSQNTQTT